MRIKDIPEAKVQKAATRLYNNTVVNEETGCWEYIRYCNKVNGYGLFYVARINQKPLWYSAHRASYEITYGPVPEGKEVAHKCHNSKCINPEHLEAKTHKENMLMSVDAGRLAMGERVGTAKLDDTLVRTIKYGNLLDTMTQRELAELLGVQPDAIRAILKGRTWRHI